jgi:hypothetical protein
MQPPSARSTIPSLLVAIVLAAILFSGCAFRNAMERGDEFAAAGDWERAAGEYRQAYEIDPDAEEVADKLAESERRASEIALEDAEAALARRQYEAAFTRVHDAERFGGESERARKLREQIRDGMVADVATALRNNDLREAYSMSALAVKLYPGSAVTTGSLESTHDKVVQAGNSHLDKGAYAEAKQVFQMVSKYEPRRADEARAHLARVDKAWADELRGRAVAAETKRELGAALVQYARAYSLSRHEPDRAARDRLRATLVTDGAVRLAVSVRGDRERSAGFARGQRRSLDRTPLVVWDDRAVDRTAIDLAKPVCEASSRGREAAVRYVSGTRDIENPEWRRLDEESQALDRDLRDGEASLKRTRDTWDRLLGELERTEERERDLRRRALDDLEGKVEELRRKESDCESDVRGLEEKSDGGRDVSGEETRLRRRLDELSAKHAEVEKRTREHRDKAGRVEQTNAEPGSDRERNRQARADEIRDRIGRLEQERDRLDRDRDQVEGQLQRVHGRGADDGVERDLAAARDRLERVRAELRERYAQISKTATDPNQYTHEASRQKQERDQLHDAIRREEDRASDLSQRLARARSELSRVPRTVVENTYADFRYEVRDWNRTCQTSATATLASRAEQLAWRATGRATTTDSSNDGYTRYGVAVDPLQFPRSDADLVAECDSQLLAAIDKELTAVGAKNRALLMAEAERVGAVDPSKAIDLYVTAHLLDPGRDQRAIAAFLASSLDLDDLAILTR